VAFDPKADALHVAGAGGELVTMNATTGAVTRQLDLAPDLRDVLVRPGGLLVTSFRAAEVWAIDSSGAVLEHQRLGNLSMTGPIYNPSVAWRMVEAPDGSVYLANQRASANPDTVVPLTNGIAPGVPAYYGNTGCDGAVVHSAVTRVRPAWTKPSPLEPAAPPEPAPVPGPSAPPLTAPPGPGPLGLALPNAPLPVDLAVSPDSSRVAVVAAGGDAVHVRTAHTIAASDYASDEPGSPDSASDAAYDNRSAGCVAPLDQGGEHLTVDGQPIAVGFDGEAVLVQTRDPASLTWIEGGSRQALLLDASSVEDSGHRCSTSRPRARRASRARRATPRAATTRGRGTSTRSARAARRACAAASRRRRRFTGRATCPTCTA